MTVGIGRTRTARVCVLSILEEEFAALDTTFGPLDQVPSTPYWTPDPNTMDVVLRRSEDRGNTPASRATHELLEQFRPEVLILVGICAGIVGPGRDAVRRGDVVVPTFLHYAEYVKVAPGGKLKRYAAYDHPSVNLRGAHVEGAKIADLWRQDLPVEPPETVNPPELVYGSLVSVEKILSDPSSNEQREILEGHPEAIALDMESFGVARAVHEARTQVGYNPLFLVIRGVSDLIYAREEDVPGGHDNAAERVTWKAYAAATPAALAREVADRLLSVEDAREEHRKEERGK